MGCGTFYFQNCGWVLHPQFRTQTVNTGLVLCINTKSILWDSKFFKTVCTNKWGYSSIWNFHWNHRDWLYSDVWSLEKSQELPHGYSKSRRSRLQLRRGDLAEHKEGRILVDWKETWIKVRRFLMNNWMLWLVLFLLPSRIIHWSSKGMRYFIQDVQRLHFAMESFSKCIYFL